MVYVTGTGCTTNEWGLDQARANAKEAAQLEACGSIDNVDSFRFVSESIPYSRGKNLCIDITIDIVCKHPVLSKPRRTHPAE